MHLGYTVLEFVIYTMLTGQHKRLDHAQNLYKKLQMIENLNDTAGSEYVNLRRFYGAPNTSIYRYFIVPRVCQFTAQILHDNAKRVKYF